MPHNESESKHAVVENLATKFKAKPRFEERAQNRVFPVGQTVLVKGVNTPTFSVKGTLAKVLKQIDNHSVLVQDLQFEAAHRRLQAIQARARRMRREPAPHYRKWRREIRKTYTKSASNSVLW